MTETLAEKKCTPCRGGVPPLTQAEAERFQSQTPNWELRDDSHRIERTFRLRNFREALGPDDPQLRSIKADVRDARSVTDALADAYGTVNAVSLYLEWGQETFHSIHVESAERIAARAQQGGVKRLIHVSGIGADARSQSLYIRKRGEGELTVRQAFGDAILIRPAVMFGPNDAFLTPILRLLNRLPVFPMFGNGQMRLQPVYVEDIGQAIAKMMQWEQTGPTIFECAGPRVYSYKELLRVVASAAGIKPILFPMPLAALGRIGSDL